MPMPGAGPNFFSPVSQPDMQTTLLEDRRAWVKKDREVKLDIFLSVSDDIKVEIFEVGPPMPPTAMTAKEMLEALDEHYDGFKFEDYHHIFCHFLNLHIDHYTNLGEFNAEFKATLDDLLDHGQPLSNMQACSAYFSKLRCTQNPWVAKQIKAWDNRNEEPQLADLLKESPPWSIIRPLTMSTKASSHKSVPASIPEEPLMDTPHHSDGEYSPSEHSISTVSSAKPSHSRDGSSSTTGSQEITIHASYEDLTDIQLEAFPEVPTGVPALYSIPQRVSSISKISLQSMHSLPPINRPLPPIPPTGERSRSVSPQNTSTKPRRKNVKPPTRLPSPTTTTLQGLEQTHPALRSPLPKPDSHPEPTVTPEQLEFHPSPRQLSPPLTPPSHHRPTFTPPEIQADVPSAHIAAVMRTLTPSPPPTISLAPPSPETRRPTSSRSAVVPSDAGFSDWAQTRPLLRIDSDASSVLSLPLQGAVRSVTPEFADHTISEGQPARKSPSYSTTPPLRGEQLARVKFEAGSPRRGLVVPSEEEKKARKRSWSIKARLSARHGIREII